MTDAFFDYAIEVNSSVWLIACNVNSINSEPSPLYGGSFTNSTEISSFDNTAPLTISLGNIGTNSDYGTTGLSEIVVPRPSNWIQVNHSAGQDLIFEGVQGMPTLQAGYTYRFLMGDNEYDDQTTNTQLASGDVLRFTADGTTEYTTGITRSGTVGVNGSYVEFAVPSDVPPLWWYDGAAGISQNNGVSISGSSYVAPVTGVTLEGPAANQTGTNLFDTTDHGWLSVDETLSAGERLVLDGAFLADLVGAMPANSELYIGLKDSAWTDASSTAGFEGGAYFKISVGSSSNAAIYARADGAYSPPVVFTTVADMANWNVFLELTSDGNNIRIGFNTSATDNASSTAYDNWTSTRKTQTNNQGFGLTSVDIMILGDGNFAGNVAGMDTADVDWTGLSEVTVPQPPVTNLTTWTKAVDFSGGSEYLLKANSNYLYTPLMMANIAATVAAPTAGQTVASGHPWATAITFLADGNASNQHIWNNGEGAGSTDDNIYLRLDSNRNLYFGWGRSGALNECLIWSGINTSLWWDVYIGFNGTRLSGANATTFNLANVFDIQVRPVGGTLSQRNTASNWTSSGGRMDRQFTGSFTIGGRGNNRNFHGKVAAMTVTTLRCGVAMPTSAEIDLMLKDPIKWVTDYKIGNAYRRPSVTTDTSNFQLNSLDSANGTQVWLMGDGASDSYSNGIRSYIYPTELNRSRLHFNSMVSNDIETVTITGRT